VLFIFDWDGTLCDSTAKITEAMQLAAIDMGWQPLPDAVICNIIGLGLPEAILALYPSVTEQQRAQIRDRYAVNFLRLDDDNASLFFPFVAETLLDLRKQGHLLAVATGKSRRGLDRVLRGFGLEHFFDATRCADETASKPNPLMLEELLRQFNVIHSNAVMIGDTEYDMEMARSIAMPRIAVSYGAHHADRLRPYLPELCVDRIDEILQWHRLN
jgi:phosphoglycolate phosphatase